MKNVAYVGKEVLMELMAFDQTFNLKLLNALYKVKIESKVNTFILVLFNTKREIFCTYLIFDTDIDQFHIL